MIRRYLALVALRGAVRPARAAADRVALAAARARGGRAGLAGRRAKRWRWPGCCGWPPRRLYRAALWCLPMVAGVAGRHRAAAASAPAQRHRAPGPRRGAGLDRVDRWRPTTRGWRCGTWARPGSVAAAAVTIAPAAIPLGLVAGGAGLVVPDLPRWRPGAGGLSPSSPVAFDLRQWRHQVRSARARIAAPGSVPLTMPDGARGRRGHPGRRAPAAAGGRAPVRQAALAPGRDRDHRHREDHAAAAAVGRVHGRGAAAATRPAPGGGRCWSCSTARAAPTRGGSPTGPAGCCATPARGPRRSGRTRRACRCGTLPPGPAHHHAARPDRARHGAAAYYADVMEAMVALAGRRAAPGRRPARPTSWPGSTPAG